jgi:hypothetical protein
MARAPQNMTRSAPRPTRAPPACAANPPRSARKSSEVPATRGIRLRGFQGASAPSFFCIGRQSVKHVPKQGWFSNEVEINFDDRPNVTARNVCPLAPAPAVSLSHSYLAAIGVPPIRVPITSPEITISTRRFCCLPLAVPLEATGSLFPKPFAVTEPAAMPSCVR